MPGHYLTVRPASAVEFVKVHGKGLEGNLDGGSPDRDVAVLLPPSYRTAKDRRYPVVYMLHGFTEKMGKWCGLEKFWINLPEVIEHASVANAAEMIIVMPDAYTRYEGSMYSISVTTGDWCASMTETKEGSVRLCRLRSGCSLR